MKTFRKILLGAAAAGLMTGMATVANAQASTAEATTAVTIIRPISIAKVTDLSFGTIVRPAADGVVSLSTAGVVTGAVNVGANSTRTAASFTVSGEAGQTYTIAEVATLGDFTLTLVKAVAGNGTPAASISTTEAGGTGTLGGTLGEGATATLTYGASFPITTAAATGAYTGSLAVTVNYQ